MPLSPEEVRHTTTLAGAVGGVLWAMATVFAAVLGPTSPWPPEARTVARAVADGVFSVVGGVIGGHYVGPAICLVRHVTQPQLISLIGLLVGMVFWKVTPRIAAAVGKLLTMFSAGKFGALLDFLEKLRQANV